MRGDDTREEEDDERARGWARLACDRAVEHAGGETAVEDLPGVAPVAADDAFDAVEDITLSVGQSTTDTLAVVFG